MHSVMRLAQDAWFSQMDVLFTCTALIFNFIGRKGSPLTSIALVSLTRWVSSIRGSYLSITRIKSSPERRSPDKVKRPIKYDLRDIFVKAEQVCRQWCISSYRVNVQVKACRWCCGFRFRKPRAVAGR